MKSEKMIGSHASLVCESLCNKGVVQEFDSVIAEIYKYCHRLDRIEPQLIPFEWLERAIAFVHTEHVLLRRDQTVYRYWSAWSKPFWGGAIQGVTCALIWKCMVCGNERMFGREDGVCDGSVL